MSEAPQPPVSPDTSAPKTQPTFARRHLGKLILLALVLVPALGGAGYLKVAWLFSYSSGERVGFVQKLSHKGWVCRTWEGELAMVHLPGSAPEIFSFSVRDDRVAAQINDLQGKRAALHYEQKKGLPRCLGESEYFVTGVRLVQ